MRLRIITPLLIVVDEDVLSVRAEDASGAFGILQGHARFLTALAISIVSWRTTTAEQFCALRGGAMTVGAASNIDIATREAIRGNDLASLDTEVLARFQSDADEERSEHVEAMRLQVNAIRRMVSRLGTSATARTLR